MARPTTADGRLRALANLAAASAARRRVDPDRVRALHAAGRTDREAAAELGCSVARVKQIRQDLGLSSRGRPHTAAGRAALAAALRETAARAGVASLRQTNPGDPHRAARRAALAAAYGLPADLYPCQVAVLLALAGGPRTTAELVAPAGRRPRASATDAYQAFNCPRLPGGNYLKDLRLRGLVAFTGRRSLGAGGGFAPGHYLLTETAMDLLGRAGRAT